MKTTEAQIGVGTLHQFVGHGCEDCAGTGWYGDNGPGIPGNAEFVRCDCGASEMCSCGWHKYRFVGGVAWCDECNRQADLDICRLYHPLPNPAVLDRAAKGSSDE